MQFTKIIETCLYVSNLEETMNFYQNKLGLTVVNFVKDHHVFFRAGSSVLLCFLPEITQFDTRLPHHFGSGKLHLAFETTKHDYEKWKKLIQSKQIPIEHEQVWERGFWSFYFRDPDKHLLEIIEQGVWD